MGEEFCLYAFDVGGILPDYLPEYLVGGNADLSGIFIGNHLRVLFERRKRNYPKII